MMSEMSTEKGVEEREKRRSGDVIADEIKTE
jgi:hypothetical protein